MTLLIGNDIEFLDSIKGYLNKSFSMKDLREAAYILGTRSIEIDQDTYLDFYKAHTLMKF